MKCMHNDTKTTLFKMKCMVKEAKTTLFGTKLLFSERESAFSVIKTDLFIYRDMLEEVLQLHCRTAINQFDLIKLRQHFAVWQENAGKNSLKLLITVILRFMEQV
jgi:hypothetical protein